jgi:Protein of unknown function (DUF3892)
MAVRIHCINKSGGYHQNPHEAISYLGWINDETNNTGRSSRLEMYDWIVNKNGTAYVQDNYGNKAYVHGATSPAGNLYVRTYSDNTWTDNLLSLPECT